MAYRTNKEVFGQQRTVVVVYNQKLLEGQMQGIEAALSKARAKLDQLQNQLRAWSQGRLRHRRPPKAESVRKQVKQILSGQFLDKLIKVEVGGGRVPRLSWRTDTAALGRLIRTRLGKTILFTDNADWTDEQIVLGYRAQERIEQAFREMKNPHFWGWSPMFHWTDSKIRVHAFYCVLALMLTSLLQRRLYEAGLELSLNRMMELLGGIVEVLLIYPSGPGQKRPLTSSCLSELNPAQQRLMEVLGLARYSSCPLR